jgi:hypothetical protein
MHDKQDETEARALVAQFFHALDTREHAQAAALLAPDGVWHRQGMALNGADAVLQALERRPANRATAHIVSNFRMAPVGRAAVRLSYYLSAYESVTDDQGRVSPPALVAVLATTDDLVRIDGQWRIACKSSLRLLPPA